MKQKVWTEQEIIELQNLIQMLNVKSLSEPVKGVEDETFTFENFVIDTEPGPQEIVEENERRDKLLNFIEKLSPRENMIIKLRFGLYDGVPKTLEEIGKRFGVSRERIRQVETKALKKLKYLIVVKGKFRNINDL